MATSPSPSAAAEVLLKRRRVRRSLSDWARYRGYEPAAHHQLIIREIEAFLASDNEVLLLFAPPGSAKSTYVSILFPSHYLARFSAEQHLGGNALCGICAALGPPGPKRHRADLGLGDDFFGSREDAYSETVRKKRWDWYVDDFSARLKPAAKRILMNTRWHEEDVGRGLHSRTSYRRLSCGPKWGHAPAEEQCA